LSHLRTGRVCLIRPEGALELDVVYGLLEAVSRARRAVGHLLLLLRALGQARKLAPLEVIGLQQLLLEGAS
jgi:hypothetical protein